MHDVLYFGDCPTIDPTPTIPPTGGTYGWSFLSPNQLQAERDDDCEPVDGEMNFSPFTMPIFRQVWTTIHRADCTAECNQPQHK